MHSEKIETEFLDLFFRFIHKYSISKDGEMKKQLMSNAMKYLQLSQTNEYSYWNPIWLGGLDSILSIVVYSLEKIFIAKSKAFEFSPQFYFQLPTS